jgi:hypothetical protein
MKQKLLLISVLIAIPLAAGAQTPGTIVDELTKRSSWGGIITIESDPQINALIGKPLSEMAALNETYVKTSGYRIQVFSGNQRQSKDEAFGKAKEVKDLFPEISTYVTYKAPVWRLRIGDFQTNEDATIFMRELKKKSPSSGKEMYIVTDEIKLIL